ncbi:MULTISPECIES: glycosyltransferase family 2 protein [unclassified Luteococcus]|uniref:glycosyltransferase family 2 protein n=1 Tax=unclassified Luteococcus TaxID=2639923 RepID=UPI00313A9951
MNSTHMKVGAVVPSVNRPDALARVVRALRHQTQPLDQLVISVPDLRGIPEEVQHDAGVQLVVGSRGASAQRNAGVAALRPEIDVVVFLDDDSVPREDYVEAVAQAFAQAPDVVALTGRMARDGAAEHRELSEEELTAALVDSHGEDLVEVRPSRELYGCNMAVRSGAARSNPFDEQLPAYSWLEDLDLARRLERQGRVVHDPRCVVAHQGNASGGREQHLRFGYSCVANPVYLRRKGSLQWRDVIRLVGRPTVGNLRGLFGQDAVTRRARLRGELLALRDLVGRRLSPVRILEI